MATLEELLAEDGYLPSDIEIDAVSRKVTLPPTLGTVAVAQDKNVRTLVIKVPRECFGVDLSPYDFSVNYSRGDGIDGSQAVDVTDSGDMLEVSWAICPHAVAEVGTVQFQLCAREHAEDGLSVVSEWHSGIASFEVDDVLDHADVFEDEAVLDWAHRVITDCLAATDAANSAIGGIDAKLEEACVAAEAEIAAAEEERAIAELERAEAEAKRAAQFEIMEQKTRDWLRYICQPGEYDPDTGVPTVAEPKANVFYFVPSSVPTDESIYQEWMWVPEEERWESFGSAKLTVTPATPDQLAAVLDGTDDGNGGGEVVNLTGWRSVVPLLKNLFARITHTHSGADIDDGTITKAKLEKTLGDSLSQSDAVLINTANATHRIEQIRVYVDGHTAHVSGLLTCVYAHTASEYTQLIASDALPTPKAGIVYCDTPAGTLAVEAGRIRVHGGTTGTSYRFHDCYAV